MDFAQVASDGGANSPSGGDCKLASSGTRCVAMALRIGERSVPLPVSGSASSARITARQQS